MPKYHKIRWRATEKKELARLAKNFNAKIDYHLKKNPALKGVLPEKVKVKDLKADIITRKDLNRTLDKLSSFSKRGMEKAVTNDKGEQATLFEIEQAKKNVRRLNAQRRAEQKRIDNAPVYVNGKELKNARRMKLENQRNPIVFDFNKIDDFKKFSKYVEDKISDTRYQKEEQAYLETLILSVQRKYSDTNAAILIDLFKKVGAEKLLKLHYEGIEEVDHDFHYNDLLKEDYKLQRTISVLGNMTNG